MSVSTSAFASFEWGRAIREGDRDVAEPLMMALATPASRGVLTVGSTSVCVDRIGAQVFIGDDEAALVITAPERFAVIDCPRERLGAKFPELSMP